MIVLSLVFPAKSYEVADYVFLLGGGLRSCFSTFYGLLAALEFLVLGDLDMLDFLIYSIYSFLSYFDPPPPMIIIFINRTDHHFPFKPKLCLILLANN